MSNSAVFCITCVCFIPPSLILVVWTTGSHQSITFNDGLQGTASGSVWAVLEQGSTMQPPHTREQVKGAQLAHTQQQGTEHTLGDSGVPPGPAAGPASVCVSGAYHTLAFCSVS